LWSDLRSSHKKHKNKAEEGSVKTESGIKLPDKNDRGKL
jgi:hypothetical protein